jgi:bifunctional non-homologous end joining protein LigD
MRGQHGIQLQLCCPAALPPDGDQWLHEIKLDGYRLLCFIDSGKVVLRTRNDLDWTGRFPQLAKAANALPLKDAVLDGEVVALRPDGTTSFRPRCGTSTKSG